MGSHYRRFRSDVLPCACGSVALRVVQPLLLGGNRVWDVCARTGLVASQCRAGGALLGHSPDAPDDLVSSDAH